jgi:hypothetical protein
LAGSQSGCAGSYLRILPKFLNNLPFFTEQLS